MGLTRIEAKNLLDSHGSNTLRANQSTALVLQFIAKFKNPLVVVLLIASFVSAFSGEVTNFALISSGDLIPADSFVLEVKDLLVNQSLLTGESFPVEKRPVSLPETAIQLQDAANAVFMGPSDVGGSARIPINCLMEVLMVSLLMSLMNLVLMEQQF